MVSVAIIHSSDQISLTLPSIFPSSTPTACHSQQSSTPDDAAPPPSVQAAAPKSPSTDRIPIPANFKSDAWNASTSLPTFLNPPAWERDQQPAQQRGRVRVVPGRDQGEKEWARTRTLWRPSIMRFLGFRCKGRRRIYERRIEGWRSSCILTR
jgi:hypothetical protein